MDFLGVSPISWRPGIDLQLVNPMQLNRMIATYLAAPRRLKESWLHKGWLSETILKLRGFSADSHDEPFSRPIRPASGTERWTQKGETWRASANSNTGLAASKRALTLIL
jgi:hypothetical protein